MDILYAFFNLERAIFCFPVYPDQFSFREAGFDRLCGNSWVRTRLQERAEVESIEAEWQVLEIAKEHFFLPQCDVRIAHAEAYLSESREDYDLLFSDLHNGQSSSRSLLTPEFVNSCYRRLNTNGILVVNNLPADLKDMKAVLHELKKVFPYLMCYQVTGFQNVIVFCGKKSFYDKNAILRRIKLLKSPNWLELETIAAGLVYSP